jgi:hypothetical protein
MSEEKTKEKIEVANGQPINIKLSDEQNKELDYFIKLPLRSADQLMKKLYSDDNFYETATYAWVNEKDAKKLFLYGVCKEVIKACIELMNDKEFLQEFPSKKDLDHIFKIIIGSISDAQTYRIRKMIELLTFLILFNKNTKRDEEYRIYLNAENMDLSLSRQKDFQELYEGRAISNTQHSIDDFANRINEDMKKMGVTDIWFLDKNKLKKQKPTIFKSMRTLYLEALLVANTDQRMALGVSYGRGYSHASQSVHPLLGSHDYGKENNDTKYIIVNFSYLSLICMHIMHFAYKIAGIEDVAGITKIMGENFEKSEASKSIASFSRVFKRGDIVLTAWTDLAEIIDEHTSRYGYKAYKVRFISKPPLPEFPEDWLEAQMIMARLMSKDMVRGFYEKSALSVYKDKEVSDIIKEVLKLPDEELLKYAEKIFLDLHNKGVLIPMLIQTGFLKKRKELEF